MVPKNGRMKMCDLQCIHFYDLGVEIYQLSDIKSNKIADDRLCFNGYEFMS